jgi:hypothetical protein
VASGRLLGAVHALPVAGTADLPISDQPHRRLRRTVAAHALPDLRRVDLHLPQDPCRRVVLVEQPEQQVFGPDVVVTKQASLLLSRHHRATCGITETLEHPGPPSRPLTEEHAARVLPDGPLHDRRDVWLGFMHGVGCLRLDSGNTVDAIQIAIERRHQAVAPLRHRGQIGLGEVDSCRLVEFDGTEQHGFLCRLHGRVGEDRAHERGDLGRVCSYTDSRT